MTVAELIVILSGMPQDLPVMLMDEDGEGSFDIEEVDQGVVTDDDVEIDAVRLFP
jgi:hypothetical protein